MKPPPNIAGALFKFGCSSYYMDAKEAILSQYLAALEMLKHAIVQCPDGLWDDPHNQNRFWRSAYHALFYTHLYLQTSESEFTAWSGHREKYHRLEFLPQPTAEQPELGKAYSKEEELAYLQICREQAKEKVAVLDLEAASGFSWLPFSKLELQLYNLRHLQQHIGELAERLWSRSAVEVDWVGGTSD